MRAFPPVFTLELRFWGCQTMEATAQQPYKYFGEDQSKQWPPHPASLAPPANDPGTSDKGNRRGNFLREAIPQLPIVLAFLLCATNILLPGIGTIIAGLSVFCCARVVGSTRGRCGVFLINLGVGLAQILLVPLFLFGWIWSIMWGVAFIAVASEGEIQEHKVTSQLDHSVYVNQRSIPQVITS